MIPELRFAHVRKIKKMMAQVFAVVCSKVVSKDMTSSSGLSQTVKLTSCPHPRVCLILWLCWIFTWQKFPQNFCVSVSTSNCIEVFTVCFCVSARLQLGPMLVSLWTLFSRGQAARVTHLNNVESEKIEQWGLQNSWSFAISLIKYSLKTDTHKDLNGCSSLILLNQTIMSGSFYQTNLTEKADMKQERGSVCFLKGLKLHTAGFLLVLDTSSEWRPGFAQASTF